MSTTRTRLRGLGASLLILLFLIGTPLVLLAIGVTPWTEDIGELRALLTSPDDGTLAMLVIGVVAWIAWMSVAASFVVEILAAIRGIQAPHLPGLGAPQRFAGQLVAVAALLFTVTPGILPVFTPQPVRAATAPEVPQSSAVQQPVPVVQTEPVATPRVHADKPEPVTIDYTVRRGDTLWKIAKEKLGDGVRYTEIVDLNEEALHGHPDFIQPGLVLRLPREATTLEDAGWTDREAGQTYEVEPGDTLWDIADDKLGEPTRYPEIFDATRDTVQADGAHLRDPDLIRPGWKLTIPRAAPESPPVVDPEPAEDSPVVPGGDRPGQTPGMRTPPVETPSASDAPTTATADEADESDDATASPSWLLPGLAGGGALLAGSILIAVRAHRRTQQRYRRPGHTIAPPPPEVRAVEKTVVATAVPAAESVGQLDKLLRHLAAHTDSRPRLNAVEVDKRTVTLHLVEPLDLPEPWTGSDTTWTTPLDSPVGDEDELSPYPLLVSVGQDAQGHLWLLDLEHLGIVSLSGDARHREALARHLAAELALNPWAVLAEIDIIDLAPELEPLDSWRVNHHTIDDTEFLLGIHKSTEPATRPGHFDPDPFYALLLPVAARGDAVAALVDIVHRQQSRSGLGIVSVGAATPGDVILELTAEGRLAVPHLGVDLTAAGLTAEEAGACAAIVELTFDADDTVRIPRHRESSGWRALADQGGALIDDLTEERPMSVAGAASLLPEATQRYEAVAAATEEDVATLAPAVPTQTRRLVEDADPQLDDDLAEWRDPASPLPKLHLLGPVTFDAESVAERPAYFAELVTYLVLHPAGVSSAEIEEAFGISRSRARTDIGLLRRWLGTNPRNGTPHLPAATTSPAPANGGTGGYQLHDVLVDLDLFRRLRARAQAHGADGMTDLVTALELVTGPPFSSLRNKGWSWLLDGERVHEIATSAVADVAHIVATDAISRGDLARARLAAETGCKAAPYDDICRLDLAKVEKASGHSELAEQIIDKDVCNRSDDQLPPIDLPERTREVVKNNDWGHPKRRRPRPE